MCWTIVSSSSLVRNWLNIAIGSSGEVFAGRLIIEVVDQRVVAGN